MKRHAVGVRVEGGFEQESLPIKGMDETAVGVESASNSNKTKKATKMLIPANNRHRIFGVAPFLLEQWNWHQQNRCATGGGDVAGLPSIILAGDSGGSQKMTSVREERRTQGRMRM